VSINRFKPSGRVRKLLLALECGALFIAGPAAGAAGLLPVLVIPILLLMAMICWAVLRFDHKIHLRQLLRPRVPAREWRRVLVIYLVALPCLLGLLWVIKPEALFTLMIQHTKIWLLILVAYPLVSVFPQELIYRSFFFERYRPLFGSGFGMVLISAVLFGFAHLIFHNWVAVVLTMLGACLFGTTYQRTSSLLLVCVEHALYGCAAFTIGYGEFFFDKSMRLLL
jgi:membrane protease YdiL (CAAX protease family)